MGPSPRPTDPEAALQAPVVSAELVQDALGHRVENLLWNHRTDRWYFGDFLRHAGWLGWLREAFPDARVDLASHPAYLGLYDDDRFTRRLDARDPRAVALRGYDLVVSPGPYPPNGPVPGEDAGRTVLQTWDTGWRLSRAGTVIAQGAKDELNYFRAAHPEAAGARSTGGRWAPTAARFTPIEAERTACGLDRALPGSAPVIVYNPTASNAFTRATRIPKEVDGVLTASEHARVLGDVLRLLPDHAAVVGSALKPNDHLNEQSVREVAALAAAEVGADRVVSVVDLPVAGVRTIRGCAALLASPRVCSTTGGGTGTNTHLAALTSTCALSIERGADETMRANWAHPQQFQMGSFRWRNPCEHTGVHVLDWSARTVPALLAAADAFVCHHLEAHGQEAHTLFGPAGAPTAHALARRLVEPGARALPAAPGACGELVGLMTAQARAHYAAFDDEVAYLHLTRPDSARRASSRRGLQALAHAAGADAGLAAALFEDSNLHKLLRRLAATPDADDSTAGPWSHTARGAAR